MLHSAATDTSLWICQPCDEFVRGPHEVPSMAARVLCARILASLIAGQLN